MAPETKSQTKTTTDHDEIRSWVEEHSGRPVIVRDTRDDEGGGVLRIDFPGGAGEDELKPVSWEDWFEVFERNDLAFLYQEQKSGGGDSTFFKLVQR
jgi:hypothetical protein